MKRDAIFLTIVGFLILSVAANGLMFMKLNSSNKLLGLLQQVVHASHIQEVRERPEPDEGVSLLSLRSLRATSCLGKSPLATIADIPTRSRLVADRLGRGGWVLLELLLIPDA